MVSINAYAKSEQINIGITVLQNEDEGKEDFPSKGWRTPAIPITCTIDFENHRIATSFSYEITAYELWDMDGIAPIVSYSNDYDLVECMSDISGEFQFRIVTLECTYVGYLDL